MYVSSPVSWTAPHVPAERREVGGQQRRPRSPARTACAGTARRVSSSLPSVSISHSPPPDQSLVASAGPRARRRGTPSCRRPRGGTSPTPPCISSTGVVTVGAPARCATSASPVASMTRLREDRLAPGLRLDDDAGDPVAVHHRRDEHAVQHRRASPASSTRRSATTLKPSESISYESDCDSRARPRPWRERASSNSRPIPPASTVASWRYHASPSTPTTVRLPPKQPKRSTRATSDAGARRGQRGGQATRAGADDEDVRRGGRPSSRGRAR